MELLLIRHAEPVRIVDADGPADPHLHQRGLAQAERLAVWLAEEELHALWSSPLQRARETAAPIAAAHNLAVTVDEELAEFDREANSYIPIEELKATGDPRYRIMAEGRIEEMGATDPEAFTAGVVLAMERVIEANAGRTAAVVCHGGVINLYLGHVLGIERRMFFEPAYTSISRVVASRSGVRSVRSLNEVAHLRNTGLLLT
jgi:probable phosphoglycerate mutase